MGGTPRGAIGRVERAGTPLLFLLSKGDEGHHLVNQRMTVRVRRNRNSNQQKRNGGKGSEESCSLTL